jgi:hypothetical protein
MSYLLILISTVSALAGILLGVKATTQSHDYAYPTSATKIPMEAALPRFVEPEILVYPLQVGNTLGGYLVVRFVLPLAAAAPEPDGIQDETMIADAFYSSMFAMRSLASTSDAMPPLDKMTAAFLDAANRNAGYPRFEGAFLQQLDMFEPSAMRRKNVRDRNTDVEPVVAEPKDPEPQSSH